MKRLLPLFLVAAGVAAPASAQVVDRVIGYAPRGEVHANYSIGSFDKVYDADGEEMQVGGLASGSNVTVQRLNVGASYNVAQLGALGAYVGLDFAMASRRNELNYPAPFGSVETESGFAPQNVSLEVGVRGPAYSLKAAYMKDLGPDPEVALTVAGPNAGIVTSGDLANSDGADAVVLGGEFYTPFSGFTVTAGANYYLTLKRDENVTFTAVTPSSIPSGQVTLSDYNPADYLDLHLGVAYRVADVAELGLQARYLKKFEGEFGTSSTTAAIPRSVYNNLGRGDEEAGYAVGLVPYLTLSPEFIPAQITISASTTQEYTPYGFTLVGESMPVGRRGITIGARFGF